MVLSVQVRRQRRVGAFDGRRRGPSVRVDQEDDRAQRQGAAHELQRPRPFAQHHHG